MDSLHWIEWNGMKVKKKNGTVLWRAKNYQQNSHRE